jgi:large subunit ribosomal protein L4
MTSQVYGIDGKQLRTIELNEEVFNIKVSESSIYYAIRNELANCRLGTASSKSRGEVDVRKGMRGYSKRKPWRQKGTGRARAGRAGSPVWVGGGVAFGPKPRDYSYVMPKKVKRLAMKSILSLKNKENNLKIIEDFNIDTGKTKDLLKVLINLVTVEKNKHNSRTVFILDDGLEELRRAGNNIPWLSFLSFNRLRAHDMFYGKNILMLESAALKLNEFFTQASTEAKSE